MAVNTWSSAGNTDGNTVGNWSLGALAATDTLTFDGTSVINCTFSGAISCAGISVVVAYTGAFNDGGQAFTVSANVAMTSGGSITISGAWGLAGNLTFGSAITHTGTFTMNGAAAQTLTSGGQTLYDVVINRATAGTMLFSCTTSLHTLIASATNTQVISWTGTTMTASGNITLDGTGTHILGNSITMTGASSQVSLNSTLTGVTATSCIVTMNTTTAGVFSIGKDVNSFAGFVLGASAIVTLQGISRIRVSSATAPLVFTNGGILTNNFGGIFVLTRLAPGSLINILAGTPDFKGTQAWGINTGSIGTYTLPSISYSGASAVNFSIASVGAVVTIQTLGTLSLGTMSLIIGDLGQNCTFDNSTNNMNITCAGFQIGCNTAGKTFTANYGSGTYTITAFNGSTSNLGTTNDNFQTSVWSCTGNWIFGSNHTITGTAATTSVTITNTSSITSNAKAFPGSFIINAATKTITMINALSVASALTLTAGTLNTATFTVTVTGNVAVNGTSTLTASGSTCNFGGDYTTAAGSTITINAATNYTFTKNGAVVTTNGKALPQVTFNSNFSLNDTCTITRLIRGVDGFTGIFEAGATFTVSNLAAANWSGAAAALNYTRSSIPGTQFTMVLPNAVTLTYYDSQDCIYQGFDVTANDGTSVTQGNNVRYLTFNVVTIVPAAGPVGSGFVLNDTGNGFGGVMVVTFGGIAAVGASVDEDQYAGVVPAGAMGIVNIVVTNGDGDTRTLVGGFTVTMLSRGEGGASRCYIADGAIGI